MPHIKWRFFFENERRENHENCDIHLDGVIDDSNNNEESKTWLFITTRWERLRNFLEDILNDIPLLLEIFRNFMEDEGK